MIAIDNFFLPNIDESKRDSGDYMAALKALEGNERYVFEDFTKKFDHQSFMNKILPAITKFYNVNEPILFHLWLQNCNGVRKYNTQQDFRMRSGQISLGLS